MWHNYNFFLLANSLVLNLNYSVKYRNTLVVSLFVEEIENLQNCPIHCVSLARKGGRDMHINIYFCISMNSGDVNTVTRAIKHYVLSIVFFPLSTFLMENLYEYTIVRVFCLAIYIQILAPSTSITSCQLSSLVLTKFKYSVLKRRVFLSVFLESCFFFKCNCKNEI